MKTVVKRGAILLLSLTAVVCCSCGKTRTEDEKVQDDTKNEAIVTDETGEVIREEKTAETEDPAEEEMPYIEGPLSRVSVHDPSIIAHKDKDGNVVYYVFGSHIDGARSTDLANWKKFTNGYAKTKNVMYGNLSENLAEPFAWAGENDSDCKGGFAVWAPHVIYNPGYVNEDGSLGAYMCYFCTSSTAWRSVIGYAVSDRVDGDFVCKGTIVYSGFTEKSATDSNSVKDKIWTNTNIDELMAEGRIDEGWNSNWGHGASYDSSYAPNAIDPAILFDEEGRMWMSYGSWSGGIYILELDPKTGDAIYPKSNGKTEDGRVIDKYFGTRIAGGFTKSGEGPFIVYDKKTGYYYLYTTYNYLDSKSGYNMRLFRSVNPTGPYLDARGNSAVFASRTTIMYDIGIKVMGNYKFGNFSNGYRSPGHCSSFIDGDGQMYLIYHTRFEKSGERHQVRVHQQFVNEMGWPVTAVFENRGDRISETGYSVKAIAGEYEFINHGTNPDGASVREPVKIALNADGTVTGEAEGTWEEKKDSYYATFTINGVKFYGVFFKQHDEQSRPGYVMTFSAIGENNETIWGVKIPE